MPAETDVVDQLATYGAWLAARHDLVVGAGSPPDLRPSTGRPVPTEVPVVAELSPRAGRAGARWLAAAAAAVLVIGAAVAIATSGSSRPADQPAGPPAPLYVLPDDGAAVANPSVGDVTVPAGAGLVVGTPEGAGFADPVLISVTDEPPIVDPERWRDLDLATGPALVDDTGPIVVQIAQRRDDRWLLASAGTEQRAAAALERTTLDDDGALALAGSPALAAITSYRQPSLEVRSTYFETDGGIVVETITAPDPLSIATMGEHVEPITVDGHAGWLIRDERHPDGAWTGLVWAPRPGTVVAVSGTTDEATLLDAAHDLEAVDEATWLGRVGPLTG